MGGFAPEGGEGLRLQAKQMFGEACSRQQVGVCACTHTHTHTHPRQSPAVPSVFEEPEGQCGWSGQQGGEVRRGTSEVTGPEFVEPWRPL